MSILQGLFCLLIGFSISILSSFNESQPCVLRAQHTKPLVDDPFIEQGKPIERELKGSESHLYRIRLESNQFLNLVVDQRGIDVLVTLFGADGKKLLEVDSPNGSRGTEPLWFLTETAGEYKIEVRSLEKDAASGRYEIKINELRAAGSDDRNFIFAKKLIAEGTKLANERKEESTAKAIEKLAEATRLARIMEDKKRKASAIKEIGGLYESMRKQEETLQLYLEAARLFEEAGLKREAAIAFNDVGAVPDGWTEALPYYEKSLALSEAINDKELIAKVQGNIGVIYREQGKTEQAFDLLRSSLKLATELGNKLIAANALTNIGNGHASQGRLLEAIEHYQKALAIHEARDDKVSMARQLINLGNVQAMLGNSGDALVSYEKALALIEASKRTSGVLLSNIGNIYKSRGNNIRAMEYYQKGLALTELRGPRWGVAGALVNIASLYLNQGNYAQALRHSQKALEIFVEVDSTDGIISSLTSLGEVHEAQGNTTEALGHYQKALTRSETAGLKDHVASALSHIAKAYLSQGDHAQALDYFQRALKLTEKTGNRENLPETLRGLAEAHLLQNNYPRALEFADRAAAAEQQADWESYAIAARAYRALNQPDKARLKYEAAIDAIEALRSQIAGGEEERQRFMESKVEPYQELIGLLVAEGRAEEALAVAERSKGRVLLDVMSSGRISVSKSMTPQEMAEERRLNDNLVSLNIQITKESQRPQVDQKHLADLRSKLDKSRLNYEAFRTKLYAAHPNLKVQRGEVVLIKLQQALSLLPDEKSSLLEYVVSQNRTYLFVITRSGKAARPVLKVYSIDVKQKDLKTLAESYRQKLAKADLDFRAPGLKLYDLLLKPAQEQIQGKTSLMIVPDGVLWEVPFQALQSSAQRYVVEDQSVFYAPSLTVLREIVRPHRKPTSSAELTLLGLGNPDIGTPSKQRVKAVFMDEKLDPLPEAEKQVAALATLYGVKQSTVYTGSEAREERAKSEAPSYRVLHFATHGILNSTSPMYSHLLLSQKAGDAQEDGLLEAWEVMDLNLNADIVVLAACETARGRVGAGEGMIGMSWAFFVAGSPTTVASQWKVESRSTTELMLEFHRNLKKRIHASSLKPSVSKARALQLASLKLLRSSEYRHPFYWAGFVLVGDGF